MVTILYFVNNAKIPNVIMSVQTKIQLYASIKKQAQDTLTKMSVLGVVIVLKPARLNRRGLTSMRKIMLPLNATFAGGGQAALFV
jgi:hypothetical protein